MKNLNGILLLLCMSLPFYGYCIAHGFPTTFQQTLYLIFCTSVINAMILIVFIFTLVVFGLPIPKIFKPFKK
jgi:hypothetical protein